ncbi:type II toxin-antitoxin system VapC family toxin [bacterium]|nr:type II toxin-antitoxin system VapC family toxin [bacterium]
MGVRAVRVTADTHVIIWDALKPDKLSRRAREAIAAANQSDGIIFCDISLWEIAMLMEKKRIQIDGDYLGLIRLVKASNHYIHHGITPEIAALSARLPAEVSLDPADRIIAATALITDTRLITADQKLRRSKIIKTIW